MYIHLSEYIYIRTPQLSVEVKGHFMSKVENLLCTIAFKKILSHGKKWLSLLAFSFEQPFFMLFFCFDFFFFFAFLSLQVTTSTREIILNSVDIVISKAVLSVAGKGTFYNKFLWKGLTLTFWYLWMENNQIISQQVNQYSPDRVDHWYSVCSYTQSS